MLRTLKCTQGKADVVSEEADTLYEVVDSARSREERVWEAVELCTCRGVREVALLMFYAGRIMCDVMVQWCIWCNSEYARCSACLCMKCIVEAMSTCSTVVLNLFSLEAHFNCLKIQAGHHQSETVILRSFNMSKAKSRGSGEGSPPQKFFEKSNLKLFILVHILSNYLKLDA